MAENTQLPWQAWCMTCASDPSIPARVWTGMSEEEASTGVLEHIKQEHAGVGKVGTWRNPGVQWTAR